MACIAAVVLVDGLKHLKDESFSLKHLPSALCDIKLSNSAGLIQRASYNNFHRQLPLTGTSPTFMAGKSTLLAFPSLRRLQHYWPLFMTCSWMSLNKDVRSRWP